jgi:hypothetical protein
MGRQGWRLRRRRAPAKTSESNLSAGVVWIDISAAATVAVAVPSLGSLLFPYSFLFSLKV